LKWLKGILLKMFESNLTPSRMRVDLVVFNAQIVARHGGTSCNPSYSGGRSRRTEYGRLALEKLGRPYHKTMQTKGLRV
jgi:hypothetical protein